MDAWARGEAETPRHKADGEQTIETQICNLVIDIVYVTCYVPLNVMYEGVCHVRCVACMYASAFSSKPRRNNRETFYLFASAAVAAAATDSFASDSAFAAIPAAVAAWIFAWT